ncbi:hypothetical protein F4810DRAFT_151449 [Camillea tinctor]|nr:hypothetical protein F4810DRAFT_151449 [Camillea tinctor]
MVGGWIDGREGGVSVYRQHREVSEVVVVVVLVVVTDMTMFKQKPGQWELPGLRCLRSNHHADVSNLYMQCIVAVKTMAVKFSFFFLVCIFPTVLYCVLFCCGICRDRGSVRVWYRENRMGRG